MARSASFLRVMEQVNKFFNSCTKSRFFQGRLPNLTAILFLISPGTAIIICSVFSRYLEEKGTRADLRVAKNSDLDSGVLNLNLCKIRPCLLNMAIRVLVPPMSIMRYILLV